MAVGSWQFERSEFRNSLRDGSWQSVVIRKLYTIKKEINANKRLQKS
jgi:hypothetical protein